MGFISRQSQTVLSNEELKRVAPSIFAETPYHGMSDRYAFIPTIKLVDALREMGLQPFYAVQAVARADDKKAFTKHLLRLRDTRQGHAAQLPALGGLFPEVVITNSHDGACTFQFDAGVFREICINGLVTGDSYEKIRVRHTGSVDGILDATFKIVESFPRVLEQCQQFSQIAVDKPVALLLAEEALTCRYESLDKAPVEPSALLRPRRREDGAQNLFNVFNTVQENLIGGKAEGYKQVEVNGRRFAKHGKVRKVNGIAEDTKLNRALWSITERMAAILGKAA